MTVPGVDAKEPSSADWAALQAGIAGDVILPGSPGYDVARRPATARFAATRPAAVVRCARPGDVAETIALARRLRLPAVPRSGGHCFAGRSSTPGVVIDVTPMGATEVRSAGTATVGAGARLGDLTRSLARHDAAIPAGCGPGVGIAGLTLGGGIGVLGRRYGLTCDRLRAAQVVLADGRVIDCDGDHHGGLFWALRGAGGGQFGVVTSLTFATVPAEPVTVFRLGWPLSQAPALIGAWQDWAPAAPARLSASLLVTAHGGTGHPPQVSLNGAALATEPATQEMLGQFAALAQAEPAAGATAHLPYPEAKRHLAALGDAMRGISPGDAGEEGHEYSKSEFFARPLPAEGIAALLTEFQRDLGPGQRRELDFTPMGGAYNQVPAGATAFPHRSAAFLLKQAAIMPPGAPARELAAARRWLAGSWETAHRWGTGGVYPNFPDPGLTGWAAAYHGPNYERLRRVKSEYDPTGFFRFAQGVSQ